MSTLWQKAKLEDVCLRITDGAHQSPKSVPFGKPMASVKDLTHFGVKVDGARHISEHDYDALIAQGCRPEMGDVLIAKDGNSALDTVCVQKDTAHFVLLSSVAIIRPKPKQLLPRFLVYVFRNPPYIEYLKTNFISGAAIPRVVLRDFKRAELLLPPLPEQSLIATTLGALDDKIDLNRRMNEMLEAMARALFKDWFVDFGPTRAKMEGREPYLAPDLWALFPDRLDDEGKPEGWETRRIEQLLELAYGKALKATDREPGSVPVYGSGGVTGYHSVHLVEGPSIIVGRKGTVGSLYWEDAPFFPIDTVFYVRPIAPLSFCFYSLLQHGLENMNTDAAVPGLNRNNVYRLEVAWSGDRLIGQFDDFFQPLRRRVRHNTDESRTLAQTRDLLLPKLMSGEIRVRDAERMVEDVV